MKKLTLLIIVLFAGFKLSAAVTDGPDSLKQQLQLTTNDSLKAPLYTQIAEQYLHFDTIRNKHQRYIYQVNAITYTLQALHLYSRFNDTVGLRSCFNNLAKVYHAQKNYSQAKWFVLQSINLSRAKNDVLNIITSLMDLASVKIDIKDYKLALKDLNEASLLSSKNHFATEESTVQQHLAILYSNMHDYAKETAALKRAGDINDSLKHDEEAKLTAKINTQDSVINKKKLYTTSKKKVSRASYSTNKSNSLKRIASL